MNQQREVEFGVYKQNVKRRELMEEESSGLFATYTDPSRNISVGNTKSELSGVLRRQMALLEGKLISCHGLSVRPRYFRFKTIFSFSPEKMSQSFADETT